MDTNVEKYCAVCGRRMTWRKKWRHNWEGVIYCSSACRKAGLSDLDQQCETAILILLEALGRNRTICPSEAAVKVAAGSSEGNWKPLMTTVRNAARRLVAKGLVEIVQHGRAVDPSTAKGPIRIRRRYPR